MALRWRDEPHALDELLRDHLGARAVFGRGAQDETRIARKFRVRDVVVVIDPGRKPRAEAVDERSRDLFEPSAGRLGSEGEIEDHDAPRKVARFRELARSPEDDGGHGREGTGIRCAPARRSDPGAKNRRHLQTARRSTGERASENPGPGAPVVRNADKRISSAVLFPSFQHSVI